MTGMKLIPNRYRQELLQTAFNARIDAFCNAVQSACKGPHCTQTRDVDIAANFDFLHAELTTLEKLTREHGISVQEPPDPELVEYQRLKVKFERSQ